MVGREPQAIRKAADFIVAHVPSAQFSGISNPKRQGAFGYHHSRNHLAKFNPGDQSTRHALDRQGAADACSGLDITLDRVRMISITKRVIDGCRANDYRLRAVAEIGGTLNGQTTVAWDEKEQRLEYSWDDSHLWHIHISGWRKYADDVPAWLDIAKFIANIVEDDDMPSAQEVAKAVWAHQLALPTDKALNPTGQRTAPAGTAVAYSLVRDARSVALLTAVGMALEAMKSVNSGHTAALAEARTRLVAVEQQLSDFIEAEKEEASE